MQTRNSLHYTVVTPTGVWRVTTTNIKAVLKEIEAAKGKVLSHAVDTTACTVCERVSSRG